MHLVSRIRRSEVGAALEYGALRLYSRTPALLSGPREVPSALVFGHQKTGTSVVASVVAQQALVSNSIDLPAERLRPSDPSLHSANTLLERSSPFSCRTLVKEPHWTLFAPSLLSELPNARAAGVIREPVKTIESICYRLRLPTQELHGIPRVGPWWQPIIDGHGLATPGTSALENLARRIVLCEKVIHDTFRRFPDRMTIVQYDDFVQSTVASAKELVHFFGWDVVGEADVERQYQPGLRAASAEDKRRYRLDERQRRLVSEIVSASSSRRPEQVSVAASSAL